MTPPLPQEIKVLRQARRLLADGQTDAAWACLWAALAREPNLPAIHLALARLRWPGPDYRFWLAWFHARLTPRLYLEIGVEQGDTLALAAPGSCVIGVDPAPRGDPLRRCQGKARLYHQTSAAFFANVPPSSGLQPHGFDLAFIDGDHRFEAVLDDFINAERHAAPGAVILLHDTLPLSARTASREHRTGFYTADGWKIVPCLRSLRPDLRLVTIPTAPAGLTVVTGLAPSSRTLADRRTEVLSVYDPLPATHAVASPHAVLSLGHNDPDWMDHWLGPAQTPPS